MPEETFWKLGTWKFLANPACTVVSVGALYMKLMVGLNWLSSVNPLTRSQREPSFTLNRLTFLSWNSGKRFGWLGN